MCIRDRDVLSVIPEWPKFPYRRTLAHVGMARVVNVEQVLSLAEYRGEGTARIAIWDEQVEQNNGCFTVTFAGGRACLLYTSPSTDVKENGSFLSAQLLFGSRTKMQRRSPFSNACIMERRMPRSERGLSLIHIFNYSTSRI